MVNTRLIARLDIKGPNLVKGVHLEGMRVLGKPERSDALIGDARQSSTSPSLDK